jgi:hypothetical protein
MGRTHHAKEVAMKCPTLSIVIGFLVLIGAAAADEPSRAPDAGVPVHLAATGDATDRDTYTQKAQDDMQGWQRKLREFSKESAAEGKVAETVAEHDLDVARIAAEAASRKLQTVGADGWVSAQTSYEKASHDLAEAWDKVRPDAK